MNEITPIPLAVDGLAVHFPVARDWLGRPSRFAHALNGVDLAVERGETLGIVGESGCGKSTLANVLTGLVAPTVGRVLVDGAAVEPGRPTSRIQIVFQDPNASLDPRLVVWRVITEPLFLHRRLPRTELRDIAGRLLEQVGLRPEHMDRFPHEFSGGQRQRIAIARALAPDPEIIVLDEPTSALDVSVQAQILNLLVDLQRRRHLTYVFISHNVSVIRHVADRIAVMYLGQMVESGPTAQVLARPRHPYTRLLLESVPAVGRRPDDAAVLENGDLPSNRDLPAGCFFQGRCPLARAGCERPQQLGDTGGGHLARCHLA